MIWALVYAVALLAAGFGLGWPWGAVAVAGCLLIPLAAMRVLVRWATVHRGREYARQPLRGQVIRLAPEHIETIRPAIPGQAGDADTEGKLHEDPAAAPARDGR